MKEDQVQGPTSSIVIKDLLNKYGGCCVFTLIAICNS